MPFFLAVLGGRGAPIGSPGTCDSLYTQFDNSLSPGELSLQNFQSFFHIWLW